MNIKAAILVTFINYWYAAFGVGVFTSVYSTWCGAPIVLIAILAGAIKYLLPKQM